MANKIARAIKVEHPRALEGFGAFWESDLQMAEALQNGKALMQTCGGDMGDLEHDLKEGKASVLPLDVPVGAFSKQYNAVLKKGEFDYYLAFLTKPQPIGAR